MSDARKTRRAGSPQSTQVGFRWPALAVSAALVALVIVVFWPTLQSGFIAYDDPAYVTGNVVVQRGLTVAGLRWALMSVDSFYWHPLTWVSHMIAWQVFGGAPGGHHLINLVLHAATTVLVFAALLYMTGALGRSAVVAALFGVHPLHVEPVAWIAERKELLAGLFWFATVFAYAWYVRRPNARRYLVVVVAFLCGLMSKPVVVTLPLVLLALDAWPLNRIARVGVRKLVVEKLPLLALATAVSVLTYVGQRRAGAMTFLAHLSLRERLQHAAASYVTYLGQLCWPHPLAVLYPYTRTGVVAAVVALSLLALMTTSAIRVRAQLPSFLSGWLWFVATMAPMSGIIQVGAQSHADRFMYIPLAGLLVAVAWGAARLARMRWIAATLAAVAITATTLAASSQVRLWKNSVTLMAHTVEVTPDNPIALHLLAESLVADGRVAEAIPQYQRSLRLSPANPVGWYALGVALNATGRLSEAAVAFGEATHRNSTYGEAHYGLGATLLDLHQLDEAHRELEVALQLPMPTEYAARAQFRLGLIAAYQHDLRRARDGFQAALQLEPDLREARLNLEKALVELAAEQRAGTVAKPNRQP